MKRLLLVMIALAVSAAYALNPQTATKEELMGIKGIGPVKSAAIIKYRRHHTIRSREDLMKVEGIGEEIADNVYNNVKVGEVKQKKRIVKSRKMDAKKAKRKARKATKEAEKYPDKAAKEKAKKAQSKAKKAQSKVAKARKDLKVSPQ